jgi:hypothetical protein
MRISNLLHTGIRLAVSPCGLAVALVLFRMVVWVAWEQSYFDSDQAITGLMAKHLAQFKAFPLFFYGQHYVLGVEAWLVAPLFVVFPPSVFLLKLPLVAINIAVGVLLVRILVDDVGLAPSAAVVASLFFLLPPPITASRLAEASGVNVEPFLYTLLLWKTRRRPALFGAIAGFAFAHREFTAYAVVALLLLDLRHGRLLTRARLLDWTIVFGEMLALVALIGRLKPHADIFGPGTALTIGSEAPYWQADVATQRLCFNVAAIVPNLTWLFGKNLSALFGWHVGALRDYNLNSSQIAGHVWSWVPLATLLIITVISWLRSVRSARALTPEFPVFLMLVGAQTALVYAVLSCLVQDTMLVRYTLLTLFVPVGALAWVYRMERSVPLRALATVAAVLWASAAAWDEGRLLAEYLHRPPANDYRKLADYLEFTGIRYGEGPYWTAYTIDFLTNERVILTSNEVMRISAYEDLVRQHKDEAIRILKTAYCAAPGIPVLQWCLLDVARR